MVLDLSESSWVEVNGPWLAEQQNLGVEGLLQIYSMLHKDLGEKSADYLIKGFALLMKCFSPFKLEVRRTGYRNTLAQLTLEQNILIGISNGIDLDRRPDVTGVKALKTFYLEDFCRFAKTSENSDTRLAGLIVAELEPEQVIIS